MSERLGCVIDGPLEAVGLSSLYGMYVSAGDDRCCFVLPEGRGKNQTLIAGLEAGAGQQVDEFGGAVPDQEVLDIDGQALCDALAERLTMAVWVG